MGKCDKYRILFANKSMQPYETNLYMSEDLVVPFQSTQSKREKYMNWQNYRNEILQVWGRWNELFKTLTAPGVLNVTEILFTEQFFVR